MNFSEIKKQLMQETKSKVSESVSPDLMIIQAMTMVDELTRILNSLAKRLREWHAYTLPNLEHNVEDNEAYCRLIATRSYEDLKNEFGDAMGNVLTPEDDAMQEEVAKVVTANFELKEKLTNYIEELMKKHMANVQFLAGTNIGARMLINAGSIKKLAMMPASTIQMLGAEKALFRHLKSGARPPKHGFIINHKLVANAGNDKGKVARILSDKISQCAKIDYFKGDFIADKFLEEIEKKIKNE